MALMSWKEAVRLSDVAFRELSLQAIYAFRQGNVAPSLPARELVARSRRRVLQSKLVVSSVLGLIALGAAFLLRSSRVAASGFAAPIPLGVFQVGVFTGLLSLDVAFLWWTGMQVLPTFLSSGVLPVLEPLPIDDRTLSRATGLLYLRLFDLPAITVLVLTPVCVGFSLGLLAALAIVPGTLAAVGFAFALSLLTGRFFVRRVQGSRGGGGNLAVRWAYLVIWLVPAFAMFGFLTAAPAFFDLLADLSRSGPSLAGDLLLAAFPFPLATLPAVAASGNSGLGLDRTGWSVLIGASSAYLGLAGWATVWVLGAVRRVTALPPGLPRGEVARPVTLRTEPAPLAVLTKDLRIASRTPGYAFLILLPILDALTLGLWTLVSAPSSAAASGIGFAAVATSALLATFFGPAFFAIEVFAYSYGRTLPLSNRSLLAGKVALVAIIYLAASTIVLGLTLVRVFDPLVFTLFVVAELPGVAAAALLELGILFRRARTKGLPITNLYAGAWYAVLVSVPGLLVAGLPLVTFQIERAAGEFVALGGMTLVALAELALAAAFALGRGTS
jgi:Membrane protein of 12 TMs